MMIDLDPVKSSWTKNGKMLNKEYHRIDKEGGQDN